MKTTIKKLENFKQILYKEIQADIEKIGFNNIVRAGINHATLAAIKKNKNVSLEKMAEIKNKIDNLK